MRAFSLAKKVKLEILYFLVTRITSLRPLRHKFIKPSSTLISFCNNDNQFSRA